MNLMSMRRPAVCILILAAVAAGQPQTVTLVSNHDTTIYSENGFLSNGAGPGMHAGNTAIGFSRRALVSWDLSVIPAWSTIQSVSLQLNVAQTIAGAEPVSLHLLTAAWGEAGSVGSGLGGGGGGAAQPGDATWSHRLFPGTAWATPGGDYLAAASASLAVGGVGPAIWASTPQLVADAQGWLANPAANHGWILIGNELASVTAKRFDSHEQSNAANRPRLTITYLPPTAASATTVGAGCAGVSAQPFTLGANGLPQIGNAGFALTFSGGAAGAPFFLFLAVGLEPAPIPIGGGCTIYINIASALTFVSLGLSPIGPLPLDGGGSFALPIPLGLDPSLIGLRFDLQALAVDNPALGTSVLSNALTLILGV